MHGLGRKFKLKNAIWFYHSWVNLFLCQHHLGFKSGSNESGYDNCVVVLSGEMIKGSENPNSCHAWMNGLNVSIF